MIKKSNMFEIILTNNGIIIGREIALTNIGIVKMVLHRLESMWMVMQVRANVNMNWLSNNEILIREEIIA